MAKKKKIKFNFELFNVSELTTGFNKSIFALLTLILFCIFPKETNAGLNTWVLPSGESESGLNLISSAENVIFDIANGTTGKPIRSVTNQGWKFEDYDLGPALRSGKGRDIISGMLYGRVGLWGKGSEVKLTISNLPPGKHDVFIRYWAEAPGPDQMWYRLRAALNNKKWRILDHKSGRIVSGLGGYDSAIYEAKLGTVEGRKTDATKVSLFFKRGRHTFIARFCGVRIETKPNADIARTSPEFLSNNEVKIRNHLLKQGPMATDGKSYGIGVVPSMLKVRPKTFDSLLDIDISNGFNLSGAKGEWVSGQLVVYCPNHNLEINKLFVDPIVNKQNGERIRETDITFAPLGYLFLDRSFNLKTHGWWPEPILNFLTGGFTITKGDVQTLWLRIHISQNTSPGIYKSNVSIVPKNGPRASIPLSLRVHDFALPRAFTLKTAISTTRIEQLQGGEDFVLSYGLNPGGIYRKEPPTKKDLIRWSKDGRVNAFNVRYIGPRDLKGNTIPTKKQIDEWVDQIGRCLKNAEEVGLRNKAYLYMFDEAKQDAIPAMAVISEAVHKHFPDLLILTTSHVLGGHGSTSKLPYIKGWIPGYRSYSYEIAQQARKSYNREVWWYTCNTPRPPLPNFFTSQPAIAHRLLMGFMPYANHVDGYLYWRVEKYWPEEKSDIVSGPYIKSGWPVREWGQIVQRGPDTPLPSIRLEALRAGLQDYEYLRIAENKLAEIKKLDSKLIPLKLIKLGEEIQPYFRLPNDIVETFSVYSKNPEKLEEVRKKLAYFIETANVLLRPHLMNMN